MVFKFLIVGNVNVGKSSLISNVSNCYDPTICLDVTFKSVPVKNSNSIKVSMYDMSGNSKYLSVIQQYFKNARVVFIMFDITDHFSFTSVRRWFKDVKKHNQDNENFRAVLIGNKLDLCRFRTVTEDEAKSLALDLGIEYKEFSTKNRSLVDSYVNKVVIEAFQQIPEGVDKTNLIMQSIRPVLVPKKQKTFSKLSLCTIL
jgi:small GTP-binding protein